MPQAHLETLTLLEFRETRTQGRLLADEVRALEPATQAADLDPRLAPRLAFGRGVDGDDAERKKLVPMPYSSTKGPLSPTAVVTDQADNLRPDRDTSRKQAQRKRLMWSDLFCGGTAERDTSNKTKLSDTKFIHLH